MPASSTVEPSVRTSIRAHRTPTVVFVILDGLPVRRVDELSMPIVHRLHGDCRLAAPAMSVLTSATYPNHATFATGVDPSAHGVTANRVAGPSGECDAWAIDRAFPTIFDACSRTSPA